MLGLGIPIITYKNNLTYSHSGSNLKNLQSQFSGLSKSIDDAFNKLDKNIISLAQQNLKDKGYKPIQNRNETFLGDIQVASFYMLYKESFLGVRWQSFLNLPTGPKDDPNDLADLTSFGKTAWENSLLLNMNFWSNLNFAIRCGFKWSIPDTVLVRVPENDEDSLPNSMRLSLVNRKIGDSINSGASMTYSFSNGFALSMGLDSNYKNKDSFSGAMIGSYSPLEKDTKSYTHRIQYEVSYDSVSYFLNKKAILPVIFSINYSDSFRGQNIERLTQTEMNSTFFF